MNSTTRFAASLLILTSTTLPAPALAQEAAWSRPTYRVAYYSPSGAAYGYRPSAVASPRPVELSAPPAAAAPAQPQYTYATAGDPYGFAAILNSYRASVGLPPVAYDPSLAAWASQNNAAQSRRGLGHHINPNCFQNCGWNYGNAWSVAQGWMNSPGHRQNMLSPSITRFGIAYGPGPYWTMNAQ